MSNRVESGLVVWRSGNMFHQIKGVTLYQAELVIGLPVGK